MAKMRRSKRRIGKADLDRFGDYFAWGYRFGRIAGELPFADRVAADPDSNPVTMTAVQDAWQMLGPVFMRDWPEPHRMLWAARMFGLPHGYEHMRFSHAY